MKFKFLCRVPVAKRGVIPHKIKKGKASYQRRAKHPRKEGDVSLS